MTIRQYAAILFGTLVIALGFALVPLSAQATVDQLDEDSRFIAALMDEAEVEPVLSGFHEDDDMPSFQAWDRPDVTMDLTYAPPPQRMITVANTDKSVLAADGPAGLSWDVLARLALLSILFFAVAFYGVRKNA